MSGNPQDALLCQGLLSYSRRNKVLPYKNLLRTASLLIGSGRIDLAIADIAAMKRLGRLFQRPGTLLCALMGMFFDRIGSTVATALLTERTLSKGELEVLASALELPPWDSIAQYLDGLERWMFLSFAQQLAMGLFDLRPDEQHAKTATLLQSIDVSFIDWNAGMREFNALRDRQIEIVNRSDPGQFAQGQAELKKKSDEREREFMQNQPLLGPLAGEGREDYARRVVHGLLVGSFDLVERDSTRRQLNDEQDQLLALCKATGTKESRGSWWKRLVSRR